MYITAACPHCQTSFQVSPTLRGKQLRCPNRICGKVFVVSGDPPAAPKSVPPPPRPTSTAPPSEQRSGTVGDLVPILPAAAEKSTPPPAGPPPSEHVGNIVPLLEAKPAESGAPAWKQPPPVRRPPGSIPAIPEPAASAPAPVPASVPAAAPPRGPRKAKLDLSSPPPQQQPQAQGSQPLGPAAKEPPAAAGSPDGPRELGPGAWAAPPPVRRGEAAEPEPRATGTTKLDLAPPHARRIRRLVTGLVVAVVCILAGAGVWVYRALQKSEAHLAAQAEQHYAEGKYRLAADDWADVVKRFPDSGQVEQYRFLQKLSDVRAQLTEPLPQERIGPVLDQLQKLLDDKAHTPFLAQRAGDLGKAFTRIVHDLSGSTPPLPSNPAASLALVEKAESLRGVLLKRAGDGALSAPEQKEVATAFDDVRGKVAVARQRGKVLAQLLALEPSAGGIAAAHRLINSEEKSLAASNEVAQQLERLYKGHRASVVYLPADKEAPRPAPAKRQGAEASIVIDPVVFGTPRDAPDNDPIVLALDRGVLYALKRSNGEVKWALRVGIDTTTLPVIVRARGANPERILVLSADSATLTALDTDGNQVWKYQLSNPCLGRPLVVDHKAYLPTYDGLVHEIELSGGQPLGRYRLGQHLTVGGAREGDTDRLYFPADDSCVYVIDTRSHTCSAILYSGQRSGSLRSEPIIVAPEEKGAPRYLILNQADGLDAVRLRVFELPIRDRQSSPLVLDPEPRLEGWTWFRPFVDGEKLAVLSDAGRLGLFGVRQPRNQDPALFPLLPKGGDVNLDPLLPLPQGMERCRSQVVQAQDDDFWVLVNGQLQRLHLSWNQKEGLVLTPLWGAALPLGSPLHDSQVEEDRRTGRSMLYLVTRALGQPTCLATAVNDENGDLRWQRQLGMVCRGDPILLRPDDKGPAVVLTLDQGGGLFALDPKDFEVGGAWQSGGQRVLLAGPTEPGSGTPLLLAGPDGRSAHEIFLAPSRQELVVRTVSFGAGRQLKVDERPLPLSEMTGTGLAGTPAVVGSWLVFPLESGALVRLPLTGEGKGDDGPDWRSKHAGRQARGHVVALADDLLLMTDGVRGLTTWRWPAARKVLGTQLPIDHDRPGEPTLELPDRIAAAPVLLPGTAKQLPRVCVADTQGVLRLLVVEKDGRNEGRLTIKKTWSLGGRLSAGPFVRVLPDGAVRIGCVMDDFRRLVWLDPDSDKILWSYEPADGKALVGRPRLVGDLLAVADQAGKLVLLDPAKGQVVGPGHQLRGSVALGAAPVAFGAGRLLAPLSDGTLLLLSVEKLRGGKK